MKPSPKNWLSRNKITCLSLLNQKALTCLLVFCFMQSRAQLCFNSPAYFSSIGVVFGVCQGDFNGDGNLDVASVHSWSDGTILLGTGTGSFMPPTSFTTVGGYTTPLFSSIISADFNNDSNADIAVITSTLIEVFLGNGTGTFSIPNSTISISAKALITDDFNLDGNADLAVADNGSNSVSVLLGNGTGIFGSATSFSVGSSSDLVSADFNGDGNPDLATTNSSSGVSILLGTGTGLFNSPSNFSIPGFPLALTRGDFNSDGKTDLACVNYGTVSVLIGNGLGNFGTASNYTITSSTSMNDILIADLNGDTKDDIAVPDYVTNSIYILLGDGFGNFSTPFAFGFTSGNPVAITSGDFDGDTKSDIVIGADNSGAGISLFLNCTTVGISDKSITEETKIFPNPVSKELFVIPNTMEEHKLEIFDATGKNVFSKEFNGKSKVDVSNLAEGLYYLTIESRQGTTNTKIIVNK